MISFGGWLSYECLVAIEERHVEVETQLDSWARHLRKARYMILDATAAARLTTPLNKPVNAVAIHEEYMRLRWDVRHRRRSRNAAVRDLPHKLDSFRSFKEILEGVHDGSDAGQPGAETAGGADGS